MTIERLYTAVTFMPRGIDPSIAGTGAHNEDLKGVQPSDIHRKGYRARDREYRGT